MAVVSKFPGIVTKATKEAVGKHELEAENK